MLKNQLTFIAKEHFIKFEKKKKKEKKKEKRNRKVKYFFSFKFIHYANMSVQYTAIFHGCKNDNIRAKIRK